MLSPDEIAQRRFLVALRGFDRDEVSQFLREVGEQVRQLRTRVAELEAELVQERRSGDEATRADPRAAFQSLGEETTRILVAAEESAGEIQAKAKAAGRATLEEARREAREITDQANRQAARTVAEAERRRDGIAAELASLREDRDTFLAQLREATTAVAEVVGDLTGQPAAVAVPPAEEDEEVPSDEDVAVTVAPDVTTTGVPDDADAAEPVVARDPAADEVAPAGTTPAEGEDDRDGQDPGGAGPAAPGIAAVTAPTAPPADEAEAPEASAEGAPDDGASADGAPDDVSEPDEEAQPTVASRRDASLGSLREAMSRHGKRGLQDVQNEVLAAIRERGRRAELADLLPADADLEQLAARGTDQLADAYRAGLDDAAAAVDGHVPADAEQADRVTSALATFRTVLGHEVTSALRATLRAGLEAEEPEPQLSERVGEIFRDLRGPVLEGVVEEQLYRTYGLGLLDAWRALDVEAVQWEVGHEARCPENRCRTNAGEGAIALGSDFPSGDRVPPAHPGCTCVVVPA